MPSSAPSRSPSPRFEFENYTTMTISSCTEANKLRNGSYVRSDRFAAGGHSWRIAFYPHGRLAGTTASMSLFLLLDDDHHNAAGEDVVHVTFSFVMREAYERSPVFMSGTVPAAFSRRRNAYGFERFVLRDDFGKTALCKMDSFSIQCRITGFPAGSKGAAVQMPRSGRPDPSAVQTPPPPPSPKPSMGRVPPSAPPPTSTPAASTKPPSAPLPTPTPTPAASTKPQSAPLPTPTPTLTASPKPSSVVTAAPPPPQSSSPLPAPSVAESSAPPPSLRQDLLVAGVSGPPASVPAGQKARAPPLSGLPADLGHLLATKKGADVELEVRGKTFAAHKSVLAARSPVFMEELFGAAKEEGTSYVRIVPDMRPEAFEALLHYLYTDTLPPEMVMNLPEEGAVMLAAADRYELKDLKVLTENKLCNQHVGVSTVLPMLAVAERYQCSKLKKMCLEFIGSCRNTRAVMATNGLEILARSSPSVIKDVITEILDAREAERRRLLNFCILAAFCFILPFFLFAVFS